MPSLRAASSALLFFFCFATEVAHGESPARLPRSPLDIKPFDSVARYATAHGIALHGIEFAAPGSDSQAGDEVVYLLSLRLPADMQQWIVRLTAEGKGHGETKALPEDKIYTSTGLELHYVRTPAALAIEFIGPFEADTPGDAQVTVRHGRVVVSAESLQQGLFNYCESSIGVAERLKAAGIEHPRYYGGGRPQKPEAIESGRKQAAAFGLTPDEERLAFSVYFALRAFYAAASEIPACSEVLDQVLQKPSLWSMAGNLGLNTNFQYGWQDVRVLPPNLYPVPDPLYSLPVRLAMNKEPALRASLAVTRTDPPLRNCAGIVALAAEHPADSEKRLFLLLLSARPAKR